MTTVNPEYCTQQSFVTPKRERKALHDKSRLKESQPLSQPVLQKMLEGILQIEEKDRTSRRLKERINTLETAVKQRRERKHHKINKIAGIDTFQ